MASSTCPNSAASSSKDPDIGSFKLCLHKFWNIIKPDAFCASCFKRLNFQPPEDLPELLAKGVK